MTKELKRFETLEVTDKDIAMAFWYTDGTKEIVVLTREAAENLVESFGEIAEELD